MTIKTRRERLYERFGYISEKTDRRLFLHVTYSPGDRKGTRFSIVSKDLGTVHLHGLKEAEIWVDATLQAIWHMEQLQKEASK